MIAVGDLFEAEQSTISVDLKVKSEITSVERISALSAQWQGLSAEESTCAEPFFQPEWFTAYANAFEPQSRILLLTAWRGRDLRGVLPLIRKGNFFGQIPARTLNSLSGIHSCRFDLIHGSSDAPQVAKAMWEELKADDDWDVLEMFDVPEHGAFAYILNRAERDGFYTGKWSTRSSPYLPLSPDTHDPFMYCPEKTKGARARLDNCRKKLERMGPLTFQITKTADPEVLRRFYELEASGWKGRAGSAIAQHEELISFYTGVAEGASARGAFRMYSLISKGKPVAMEFGLLMNGCYYSPKAAYNEEFRSCSPGHLLVRNIIVDLWKLGVTKYDFLGPLAKYKTVWTPAARAHSNLYIFRPGLKGKLLYSASMRFGRAMRTWKHKLFGDPQDIGD